MSLKPVQSFYGAIVWAILILVFTIIPGKDLPEISLWQWDKLAHFTVYLILVLLIFYGYRVQYDKPAQRYKVNWLSMTGAVGYGILMEAIQGLFLADRTFDVMDITANAFGCFAGFIIFTNLYKRTQNK